MKEFVEYSSQSLVLPWHSAEISGTDLVKSDTLDSANAALIPWSEPSRFTRSMRTRSSTAHSPWTWRGLRRRFLLNVESSA